MSLTGEYSLVLCSQLKRCRDTLTNSRVRYNTVIYTDLCREIRDCNPINLLINEDDIKETRERVKQRIEEFKDKLKSFIQYHRSILVTSHGMFLDTIMGNMWYNCQQRTYSL